LPRLFFPLVFVDDDIEISDESELKRVRKLENRESESKTCHFYSHLIHVVNIVVVECVSEGELRERESERENESERAEGCECIYFEKSISFHIT
jgi:hypothetical protein